MLKRTLAALIVALTAFCGGTAQAEPLKLTFSTGSVGGGFFAVGSGIAGFASQKIPGISITAISAAGVVESINRLEQGKADFAMLNTQDPPLAWEGKAPYKKQYRNMRGMGILYMQAAQPYALKSSGIRTFKDLKGKTISVGAPGGTMHLDFFRWVEANGLDPKKDQSYVLFHLTQDTLEHMLFPLGELTKPEVRELAREAGFDNAGKSESQDICFVPDGDYAGFIERRCGHTFGPGPIVDMHGKVLGEHRGIDRYTIGQRKGIGVAAGEPLFVFRKDAETNTLVVGTDSETRAATVRANDVNLISAASIDEPLRVTAKTHYRMKAQPGWARIEDHMLVMEFDEPQRAAAPGQALVLYDGDTVVGGGTIVSA